MKSQISRRIINDISINTGVPEKDVEEMIRGQFRKVKLTIEEMDGYNDHFPTIQLPYIGKFLVTNKRKDFLRNEEGD